MKLAGSPNTLSGFVGDVAGVRQGDFASLHRGEIKFAIQPDDKSIIIGSWGRTWPVTVDSGQKQATGT